MAPSNHPTNLRASEPLSLTESHLSVEGIAYIAPPDVASTSNPAAERSRASSMTLSGTDIEMAGSETEGEKKGSGRKPVAGVMEGGGEELSRVLSRKKMEDLEKGLVGTHEPKIPLAAADGSQVIVVDWKGENDPAFPKNWSKRSRMAATLIVAAFTFLSPTSSSMIAPAVPELSARFNITNDVIQSMVVSIFVLAYAIGPLILGPLSEIYGRTIVLQLANLVYLVFNLVCGFATNTGQMLAFRFLSGVGGSAPLAIGAGVLGDLWRPEERGRAAALYSLGPLLGPAVGPLAGGWIAQCLPGDGYRWVFFSTTIACAIIQLCGLLWLKETYAPVLLLRQALALKKEMGLPPDSDKVQTVFEIQGGRKDLKHVLSHGLIRPFRMFAKEPIIQLFSAYMALIYGIIYITTVSTTEIFTDIYHESVGVAGTNFVAQGLGFLLFSQVQGRIMDWIYRKLKARNGGVGQPEFRLPLMIPASVFLPFGLLLYGWGAQHHLHWIVPDIGLFFIAGGMIGNFQAINTYLIDAFTLHAASALAAAVCLRSLCGFGFPLFAPYLWSGVGYGWGCTILAGAAIVVGWPAGPLLFKYGERIRMRSTYASKS